MNAARKRVIKFVSDRVANLERQLCRGEEKLTLIKVEMEGRIPRLHVMHGNGNHVIYAPTSTYGASLNWIVITPSFPRPFAPHSLWTKLNELFFSVCDVTWEHGERGHAPIPTYAMKGNA